MCHYAFHYSFNGSERSGFTVTNRVTFTTVFTFIHPAEMCHEWGTHFPVTISVFHGEADVEQSAHYDSFETVLTAGAEEVPRCLMVPTVLAGDRNFQRIAVLEPSSTSLHAGAR